MKKRALVLVLAMTVSIFASCAQKDTGSSGGAGPSSKIAPAKVDLKGYEFTIAEGWYYDASTTPVMEPGQSDTIDAILKRNKAIENEYNCKIKYEYYNPVNFYDLVTPSLMAGDKFADIMTPTLFGFGKFMNSDSLYDLKTLPNVDLSSACWNTIYFEAAVKGGSVYGTSAMFANPLGNAYGVFFNRRLVSDMKLEDPYQLVKDNRWTWDKFKELLKKSVKDLNGDGKYTDADQWAVTGATFDATNTFFESSGLKMFDIIDGKVKYTMANTKTYTVLNQMKEMFNIPGGFYNPNLDYDKIKKQFIDGRCVFFVDGVVKGTDLRNMKDDFGLVPFPMGPGQTKYLSSVDHNAPIVCVPKTINNKEATGTILQALAVYSAEEKAIWEGEIRYINFRDDDSVNMLKSTIFPSISTDLAFLYITLTPELGVATSEAIGNPILRDQQADSTGFIESMKEVVQSQIDDICNKAK